MTTQRKSYDFYPTPDYVVKNFLEKVNFQKVNSFLEPCRGNGVIYNKVKCSIKKYCEIRQKKRRQDYLKIPFQSKFDLIVTNPPFSIADKFLMKSIKESDCVCYLLRLNYLGSIKRANGLWKKVGMPNKLFVLSKRPSFTGKGTDSTEYAWFCWDKSNIIKANEGIHLI